jgi:hypothetical protein
MISPLGQRQIHLASNLEALRAAQDVAEQSQREAGRKLAADERLAEAQKEVPGIGRSEGLRTEERKGRQGGGAHPGSHPPEAEEDEEQADQATSADPHLDFLA